MASKTLHTVFFYLNPITPNEFKLFACFSGFAAVTATDVTADSFDRL